MTHVSMSHLSGWNTPARVSVSQMEPAMIDDNKVIYTLVAAAAETKQTLSVSSFVSIALGWERSIDTEPRDLI